jgi:hypothetical protein
MVQAGTAPIRSNRYVRELLKILDDYNAPTRADFLEVLSHVQAMEKQLAVAINGLNDMRRELETAKKQNHPAKDVMQNAVTTMQNQVEKLREKLAELKESIINGCKKAIESFKDKGVIALDGITRFFRIRPALEGMRNLIDKNIQADDKLIAKIESISTEYHLAGLHVKNMGRVMIGKETKQDVKSQGKIAAAISYPFRAERRVFSSMKKSVEKALGSFARFEEKATERKPPIKETLEKMNKKVELEKSDRIPERSRKVEHDR